MVSIRKKASSVSGIQIFNFYAKTLKEKITEISVFSLKGSMICNFIHTLYKYKSFSDAKHYITNYVKSFS